MKHFEELLPRAYRMLKGVDTPDGQRAAGTALALLKMVQKRELNDYLDRGDDSVADPISVAVVLRSWGQISELKNPGGELVYPDGKAVADQLAATVVDMTDQAALLRSLAGLVSKHSTPAATKKRAEAAALEERLLMRVPGGGVGVRGNVVDPSHTREMTKAVKVKQAEEEIRSALEVHKAAELSAAASARELRESAGKMTPPEVDILEKVLAGKEDNVALAHANLQRAIEKRAALLPADDDETNATAQTELDEEEISGQFIQKIIR
jgi:hypothetical protein